VFINFSKRSNPLHRLPNFIIFYSTSQKFRGGATFEKHADLDKKNRNSRKSRANSRNLLEPFLRSRKEENLYGHCCCCCVSLLIQLNPRAQNVSRPWREPHSRYKSELRSTKHESPHGTVKASRTPKSRGGRCANAAFMPPRTVKILGEGRPRGPCRVHADAHIDTRRGN